MSDTAAIEQASTYLAVFLTRERAAELSGQIVADLGDDAERSDVLAAAHRRLTAEVRITDEVAADVLVEEVGLTPEEAAAVLGLPDDAVVAAVDHARSIAQELDVAVPAEAAGSPATDRAAGPSEPPVRYVFDTEAPQPGPPPTFPTEEQVEVEVEEGGRRGRRTLTLLVGLLVVAAIALAVVLTTAPDRSTTADGVVATSAVTVTDARVTDRVDADGPGPPRDVFAPDEAVVFWFAYEPVRGEAVVELALARDGEHLIAPTFPLPEARTDSHVTLPRVVTEEPGRYRVELRRDGRVLAEVGFHVESQ